MADDRKLEIRGFQEADLEALQQIRAAAFAPIFRALREIVGPAISDVAFAAAETEQAALLAKLCAPTSPAQLFVAVIEARIVGFVAMSLDRDTKVGEIGLNAVHPDHAGQGIGTEMYDFVLRKMTDAGMRAATVGTGGDPSHAPARRAYRKAGFGPAVPSLWMYRTL